MIVSQVNSCSPLSDIDDSLHWWVWSDDGSKHFRKDEVFSCSASTPSAICSWHYSQVCHSPPTSVLDLPCSRWLDTTPVSRVITRCTQDIAAGTELTSFMFADRQLIIGKSMWPFPCIFTARCSSARRCSLRLAPSSLSLLDSYSSVWVSV